MARYDREDLYEKVWTLTMQKAAKEYGVSTSHSARHAKSFIFRFPAEATGTRWPQISLWSLDLSSP